MHHDDLFINAVCLHLFNPVKDFGISIYSQIKLDLHINAIVVKAHAHACLIIRCFLSKDRVSLIKDFFTYTRSLVEYASCVWSPSSVDLIRKIEAVKKPFTKRLPGFNVLDNQERLAFLGLESLELRRPWADICMTYKISFNLVYLNIDNFCCC